MHRIELSLFLLSGLLGVTAGCGGGGSASTPPPAKAVVTISPSGATVYVTNTHTRQFSATITGISNTTPHWSFLEVNNNWGLDQTGLVTGPTQINPQGIDLQVTAADGTVKTQYLESTPLVNPTLVLTGIVWGSPNAIRFGYASQYCKIDYTTVQWTTTGMTSSYTDNANGLYFTAPSGTNCSAQVSLKDLGGVSYTSNQLNFVVP